VFAMSAVAASAASAALPEFKPVPTKKKFTGTGGESSWSFSGEKVTCKKSTMSGEITSATTLGGAVLKFTGCSWKTAEGAECPLKSKTGGKEEVVTAKLKGELGTTKESGRPVALLLTPAEGKVWATLESTCGYGGIANLEGSLAGTIGVPHGKTGSLSFPSSPIKEVTTDSGTVVKPRLLYAAAPMELGASLSLTFEEVLEVT